MLTDETKKPRARRKVTKRKVLFAGWGSLIFGLFILEIAVSNTQHIDSAGLKSLTLAQAAQVASSEYQYVTIEDGKWDCNTIIYKDTSNHFTEIFLTDETDPTQIVLRARMPGKMECTDLETVELTGYLYRMNDNNKQALIEDARLASYPEASDFLEICGWCGPDNSRIGLVLSGVFAVGGLLMIMLGLRMSQDADKKGKVSEEEEENPVITWL